MLIGATYLRINKLGDKKLITIGNQKEKEYHEDLAEKGLEYKLQPVPTPNVCLSCEG